jgi:hypothetical protein
VQIQRLAAKFPTQQNRELFRRNREFERKNREFKHKNRGRLRPKPAALCGG